MNAVLKREVQVAFSLKTQSLTFRFVKWAVILFLFYRYHDTPNFWTYVGITFVFSLGLHFLYRYKTHTWTQSWGGWEFH
jgi:hypothetical protein